MITYKIHLLRTGTTGENEWKRYVGRQDLPLSDRGRDALAEMREQYIYPRAEALYASPLRRCLETAELLYPHLDPIAVEDLMDMDLGEFEGKSFDELRGSEAFTAWLSNSYENAPPGGEETEDFTRRVVAGFHQVLRHMMEEKRTSAAVITHGGVIMTLLAAIGFPRAPIQQWAVANGAGYTLQTSAQMWMRDGLVEVVGYIPTETLENDMEVYGLYDSDK